MRCPHHVCFSPDCDPKDIGVDQLYRAGSRRSVGVHFQPSNGLVCQRSFYLTQPVNFGHAFKRRRLGIPGDGNVAEIYPLVTVLLIAAAMALVRMIV